MQDKADDAQYAINVIIKELKRRDAKIPQL